MAAKRILGYYTQRFTGLTGTNHTEFRPFDFSTFGLTSRARAIIEVDCVALATSDLGNSYNDYYSARLIYTFVPPTTGSLNATYITFNAGVQLNWSSSAVSSPYGIEIACTGQATSATFTVFCAARIVSFVNND